MRKPYIGQTRSLVIAVDVGTTFSGVSYAILEPGEVPKIHGVTRRVEVVYASMHELTARDPIDFRAKNMLPETRRFLRSCTMITTGA